MKQKLNLKYWTSKSRVYIRVKDIKGEERDVSYEPTLFGLVTGIAVRRLHNWHGVILITGEVGDGKSTLGDGICGLDAYLNKTDYGIDNNIFDNDAFNAFCDDMENTLQPLKYDEAIEGTTGRDVGITGKGIAMKKKIIKKRKKKHLYVFCIDELEEYAWKFVKMADAWIHVKSYGLKRGYFDITINKNKIKSKYLALKNKQYDKANKIFPDKMNCTFMKYENIFIDDALYQKKKDEHTSSEKKDVKKEWTKEQVLAMINSGLTYIQIAKITGKSTSWVGNIKQLSTTN